MKARKYKSKLLDSLMQEISSKEMSVIKKKMIFSAELDKAIKQKGWTNKEFADKMHVTEQDVERWLSGTYNFGAEVLVDLVTVFDL